MIYVCDAIMGSGKSSAAISYMNEHSDKRFIYITPYLDEAARIKMGCPRLHFIEPSDKISQFHFTKTEHTAYLIQEGKNIATTHQAFKCYTPDMLDKIKEMGYTLIIDENVEVVEQLDITQDDIQTAVDAALIENTDGKYKLTGKKYNGLFYKPLLKLLQSRELIQVNEKGVMSHFFWELPPELLNSFKDVFILTYLFKGQSLYYMLRMYNMSFEYIGVQHTTDGKYIFGSVDGCSIPEYARHIKELLHILDKPRLNAIGDSRTALSMSWFQNNPDDVDQLRKNVANYFRNLCGDVSSDRRLWGSYCKQYGKLRGKGYWNSFLVFNARATNDYRERDRLAYLANVYMNVSERIIYYSYGIEPDEDMYALSTMVQWIWRSAIRDGKPVELYLPSKRMRTLLLDWMDTISSEGGEAVA